MRRHLLCLSLTLSLLLGAAAATQAAPYVFINIEAPVPGAVSMSLSAINNGAQIVGAYRDANSDPHAFQWHQGVFTMLEPPGAVTARAHDINDAGQIVGVYTDTGDTNHGFRWSEGVFTTLDPPGGISPDGPQAINAAGQIVGSYFAEGCDHGFLWEEGTFTTIDALVPCFWFSPVSTIPYQINAAGRIIGEYVDHSETRHGFSWENGSFGSIAAPDAILTRPIAINDAGHVVGYYELAGPPILEPVHAFLLNGGYANIDPPGATGTENDAFVASAADINNAGWVVGQYQDSTARIRSFLYHDGAFTRFDGPTALHTFADKINLGGDIIGRYFNSSGNHYFVARPATSVSGLVHLHSMTTSFDTTPMPGGPAGTFTIETSFTNTSSTPIDTPQFDVTALSNDNRLLNADVPPGTVGARLTPDVGSDGVWSPGESLDLQFVIGLQEKRLFTFRIGLLGVSGP